MVIVTDEAGMIMVPRTRRRRRRRAIALTLPQQNVQQAVVMRPRTQPVRMMPMQRTQVVTGRTVRNRRRRQRRRNVQRSVIPMGASQARPRVNALASNSGFAFNASGPMTSIANTWSDRNDMVTTKGMVSQSLGMTENGKRASIKALHPACILGPQRWPDKAANDTLVMQNTDTWLLNRNSGSEDTYNLIIWLTNLVDCPIIASAVDTSYDWQDPAILMNSNTSSIGQVKNTTYSFFYSSQWKDGKFPNSDYQQARITGRSITCDLVSNATNSQGMIYGVQFSPNMTLMPEVGGPSFGRKVTEIGKEFMGSKFARDLIIKIVAESFDVKPPTPESEKGEHCDGTDDDEDQEADEYDGVEDLVDKFSHTSFAPSGSQTGYRLVFQNWPYSPQQVIQGGPGCYSAKATEGIYMPLKHASDTLEYRETATECYLSATVPHSSDGQSTEKNVLHSEGWNMGCIIFAGIDKNAMVNVKCITALELTARTDSQMAKFVEEAPPLDKIAQQHTRAAMGNMADAYPSEYNALGKIMESIAGALEMAGIPIVSSVASIARKVNSATGNYFTNWLDNNVF